MFSPTPAGLSGHNYAEFCAAVKFRMQLAVCQSKVPKRMNENLAQDFSPIFSIISSYTVHAIAAMRVRRNARGRPPLKNPVKP